MDELTYIDVHTVRNVALELSRSSDRVDREIAEFLDKSVVVWTSPERMAQSDPYATAAPPLPSPMVKLGYAVKHAGLFEEEVAGPKRPKGMMRSPHGFVVKFIKSVIREIRDVICKPNKDRKKLSQPTNAALSAIATALMHQFHLSSATASGIVVLALLTLGQCTKKAFCDMTDDQVLEALKKGG